MKRLVPPLLVLLVFAHHGAAHAGPPSAARCKPFKPVAPGEDSYSEQKDRVKEAPIMQVTDEHTAGRPLTIEFEQGPSAYAVYYPVVEDTKFFNLQIASRGKEASLNIKQEWSWPSPNDLDVFLYWKGMRAGESQNLSLLPTADPWNPNAGPGYEFIKDVSVTRCEGYTIESKAFLAVPSTVRLSVWLDK